MVDRAEVIVNETFVNDGALDIVSDCSDGADGMVIDVLRVPLLLLNANEVRLFGLGNTILENSKLLLVIVAVCNAVAPVKFIVVSTLE